MGDDTRLILIRMLNSVGRNRRATIIISCGYLANIFTSLLLVRSIGGAALGYGEAIRGVVVLAGVAIALGCGRHVASLLRQAIPYALLLVVAQLAVRLEISGNAQRLLAGGVATTFGVVLTLNALIPGSRSLLSDRIRSTRRRWL